MIVSTHVNNAPEALSEVMWKLRTEYHEELSRNGMVRVCPHPFFLQIEEPMQRVIFDPVRDANPFFHLMEAIWMLGGHNEVSFPMFFNRKYESYAEINGKVHGAYGHRWRKHFGVDQIERVIYLLNKEPNTRRAVLGMWDPHDDLDAQKNDLPCNTHIYFRLTSEGLSMTVCNRSNDVIWGMLGANVVHFTMLQELIATATGSEVGTYQVFTNNLHFYPDLYKNSEKLWNTTAPVDYYNVYPLDPLPLLHGEETIWDFLTDCEEFPHNHETLRTRWFRNVAMPMFQAWFQRKSGVGDGLAKCDQIEARDWRMACTLWIRRRNS